MRKILLGLVLLVFLPVCVIAAEVTELDLRKAELTTNLWQQQSYNIQITLFQERIIYLKQTERQLRTAIDNLIKAEKLKKEAAKKATGANDPTMK